MAHLVINFDGEDIDLDIEMTPEQFVESFITLMQENDVFKRLVLASVEAYRMYDEKTNNG